MIDVFDHWIKHCSLLVIIICTPLSLGNSNYNYIYDARINPFIGRKWSVCICAETGATISANRDLKWWKWKRTGVITILHCLISFLYHRNRISHFISCLNKCRILNSFCHKCLKQVNQEIVKRNMFEGMNNYGMYMYTYIKN